MRVTSETWSVILLTQERKNYLILCAGLCLSQRNTFLRFSREAHYCYVSQRNNEGFFLSSTLKLEGQDICSIEQIKRRKDGFFPICLLF